MRNKKEIKTQLTKYKAELQEITQSMKSLASLRVERNLVFKKAVDALKTKNFLRGAIYGIEWTSRLNIADEANGTEVNFRKFKNIKEEENNGLKN